MACKGGLIVPTSLEPKDELEIHTSEVCMAGASLPVEVRVCLQEQLTPRELRLELVGVESYYTVWGSSHGVKTPSEFTTLPYTVMEQPSLHRGVVSRFKANIQIPINAPPSCRGKEVDVYWMLKAVLKIPKGIDIVRVVPIQVISTPISARKAMTDSPGEKSYKDCTLSLEVPRMMAAKGAVSGRLQVKALRKFQIRGIRVELRQIEDVGERKVNDMVAHQDLSGPVTLSPTESPSFAFSLQLPSAVPPTMVTPHSSLRWQVRAVLDRRMRADFNVEHDVFIYSADELT